jgi:formylglycine-generating enzyme required for sulfatase activity
MVVAGLSPTVVRQRQVAERQVERFEQRYGQVMLEFACHAAFPLTLTTDVVYLLRQEYFSGMDWSMAAELLLSNLCDVAGYDLYVMSVAVRRVLLEKLVGSEKFGVLRIDELARWMAEYIQHRLEVEPLGRSKVLGHPSHWTVLACLKSDDEMTHKIKAELGKLLAQTNDPTERFRLSALMESQGDLLVQRGLEPLKLRELMDRLASGQPLDGDLDALTQLQSALEQAGFPKLKTAGIEYATISFDETVTQNEGSLEKFEVETVTLDARGQEIEKSPQESYRYVETLPQGLNLEMVAIPSGTFLMGSRKSEHQRFENESPQHEVTVPPFFMGRYVVTQAQWRVVAGLPQVKRELEADPSNFKGNDCPVEQVSWLDAVEFCTRLSVATRREYRLPSEAEWEYACRAGTATPFHLGETITGKVANYDSSETYRNERKAKWRQRITSVGSFPLNHFGLYDMHGNVWEWCLDSWHGNYEGAPIDGSVWLDVDEAIDENSDSDNLTEENAEIPSSKVIRGGSWNDYPWVCRSACRYDFHPNNRDYYIGFRVVCAAPSSLAIRRSRSFWPKNNAKEFVGKISQ